MFCKRGEKAPEVLWVEAGGVSSLANGGASPLSLLTRAEQSPSGVRCCQFVRLHLAKSDFDMVVYRAVTRKCKVLEKCSVHSGSKNV